MWAPIAHASEKVVYSGAGMDEPRPIAQDHLDAVVKLLRRSLRYTWIVVIIGVVGVGVAAGMLRVRHPKYQSQAVLYYQEGLVWNVTGESTGGRRAIAKLREIVLARQKLQRAIEELGLFQRMVRDGKVAEVVEEMRTGVGFRINEGDTFVISYVGDSPSEALDVTAKLTDMLIEENTRLRAEQAEVNKVFLDAQKKRNEDELRAKEFERARFLAKHPEFAQEQQGPGASIRAATTKRPGNDSGSDTVLTTLRREEERLKHQISSPNEVPTRPKDPALVAAKNEAEARLAAARRDLADKKARYTDQHPDVRAADAVVREATAALQRAVDALKAAEALPSEVIEIEPKAALEARLAQVQQEIKDYQRRQETKSSGRDEPAESNESAQRIVALETEWTRLNREVTESRERFQQLDSRQFLASMAASSLTGGQAAQVKVIDPAYLPSKPLGLSNT